MVISAVAEFERDLLIERTYAGIKRAKAEGRAFGRPSDLSVAQQEQVRHQLQSGVAVAQIASTYSTCRQTLMRVRDGAQ